MQHLTMLPTEDADVLELARIDGDYEGPLNYLRLLQ